MTTEEANVFLKRFCEEHARECEEQAARIEKLNFLPQQYVKGLREIAQSCRKMAADL